MSRTPAFWILTVLLPLGSLCQPSHAEADSIELREIRALKEGLEKQSQTFHEALEKQGRSIQALSEQVAKMGQQLDARREAAPGVPPPPPPPTLTPEAPAPAATPEIRKAAPADNSARHVVEKGETLTSIAKRLNISVPELKKLNKIEDERKLQIGQSLVIPAPKTPEPPTDKNP